MRQRTRGCSIIFSLCPCIGQRSFIHLSSLYLVRFISSVTNKNLRKVTKYEVSNRSLKEGKTLQTCPLVSKL